MFSEKMGWYACLNLFFLFVGINCQYMELTTPSYFTLNVPSDFPIKPEICSTCICIHGKIDCYEQNLDTYFSFQEWEDIAYFRPNIVDLSGNALTRVTPMANLPIEELDLSHNRIEDIEHGSFRDLQELRVLDLSYNKLTSELSPHAFEGHFTPEEYAPLTSMRVLNLAYNDFRSLHPDLFEHLPELTSLDLTGNPLTPNDHVTMIAISSLPMLKNLTLSSCNLETIPGGLFKMLRELQHLDLSSNRFTTVPASIAAATNLVYLSIDKNPIETIKDNLPFLTLKKLKELRISHLSKLRSVGPKALGGLESLISLHMCYNPRLTSIDPEFLAWEDQDEVERRPVLKELYLNNNNLTEISPHFVDGWYLLESVDVSNNPYRCTCDTQWMVDVLVPIVRDLPGSSEGVAHMTCQEPIQMRGYTMKYLHDHQVRCVDEYEDIQLTLTVRNALDTISGDDDVPVNRYEEDDFHPTGSFIDKPANRYEEDDYTLTGSLIGGVVIFAIVLFLAVFWKLGYFGWLRGHIQKGSRPAASPAKA